MTARDNEADDLMAALGRSVERARMKARAKAAVHPLHRSDEAVQHVDETGHQVEYREEFSLWACWECPWVDSAFVTKDGTR